MIKKELMTKSIDMDKASGDNMNKSKKPVQNKFLATLMLSGANHDKYGELKCSMAENYVTELNKYPESPEVVLRILNAVCNKFLATLILSGANHDKYGELKYSMAENYIP